MSDCVFCKIAAGEFGTEFLFEDERVVAFKDLNLGQSRLNLLTVHHRIGLIPLNAGVVLGNLGVKDCYRVFRYRPGSFQGAVHLGVVEFSQNNFCLPAHLKHEVGVGLCQLSLLDGYIGVQILVIPLDLVTDFLERPG